MRINHNITALNTYNKLTSNTAATAKSLEKLSSGLKINKAGDNAAGLAISEKMRGQIRGLDQASTNASDAISMINTAEGALSETHSILQRMRELAVQSSNDTNVTVDRSEIQKEMNQLTSEINRIGNTTEFNTQKLLNGGGAQASDLKVTATTAGGKVGRVSSITTAVESNSNESTASASTASGVTVTIRANDSADDLSNLKVRFIDAGSGIAKSASGVIEISIEDGMSGGDIQRLVSGSSLFNGGATVSITSAAGADLTTGSAAITAARATDLATNTAATAAVAFSENGQETKGVYSFKITEAFSTVGAQVNFNLGNGITPDSYTSIRLTAVSGATTNSASGTTSGRFNIGKDSATRLSAEDQAAAIVEALKTGGWDINGVAGSGSITDLYDVRADGNTIIFTEKAALGKGAALNTLTTGGTNTAVAGVSSYVHESVVKTGSSFVIDGTEIEVVDGNGAQDALKIQQGTAIKYQDTDTVSTQMDALRSAITSNSALNTKYTAGGTGSTLELTQQAGATSNTLPEMQVSSVAGQSFKANFQIGANTAQSMTIEVKDMRSSALGIAGSKAGGAAVSEDKTVTASFTATKNVTDGTTNDSVEYALDVSTHEKATAAITIINDAIQSVSAERSKLGSYQNRLEHTINNLGTSSENLTTAESRIRDVDMAKEMMEFTKNNILSQAAQSMLAQANQQPQGVLQLLQ